MGHTQAQVSTQPQAVIPFGSASDVGDDSFPGKDDPKIHDNKYSLWMQGAIPNLP